MCSCRKAFPYIVFSELKIYTHAQTLKRFTFPKRILKDVMVSDFLKIFKIFKYFTDF